MVAATITFRSRITRTTLGRIPLWAISAPFTFVVLQLITVLLQDDAYQLTASTDAGLRKELLKCSFDRALRHSDSCRNLFICKPLEHAGEHLLFPLGE